MNTIVKDTCHFEVLPMAIHEGSFNGARAFESAHTAFEHAMKKCPHALHESFYTFGGQCVRIRIVGRELARHLVRPFSHLRMNESISAVPQRTIDLWDENETGIRRAAGSASSDSEWHEITAVSFDGRFIGQQLPNTFTCFDRKTHRIIGSIAWRDQIFIYERAKPLARPLLEWHNDLDVQVIHAGLVSRDGQGVLFAGKSGSGKSTSALACLCAGFGYLGEDYVGLQCLPEGSFMGHSLYNSVFLEAKHLARFPVLAPYVIRGKPHEEKSVVILSQVLPERLERVVPIRVLVLPRVVKASASRIRPVSKGQALLALGTSSLMQIPSRGVRGFDKLTRLVEQVPCYELELGRDLGSIPRCVEKLLDEVSQL